MNLDEIKSVNKFKDSGISTNLIKFIYYSQNCREWVKSENVLEERYNFGLQDISVEKVERNEDVDRHIYLSDMIDSLTVSLYKNKKIKFGSNRKFPSENISVLFYIEEKLVVNASYDCQEQGYGYLYKKYELGYLEEFHYSIELEKMLSEISKDIDKLRFKVEQMDKLKKEEEDKKKFTFDS